MKNTLIKNHYPGIIARIFLVLTLAGFIVLIVQSCAKDKPSEPGSGNVTTGTDGNALVSKITKQQALARLNEHFENEFSTITLKQVKGVNRKEFIEWLRSSTMAPAEDLYLKPLLKADSLQYVILQNVTVKSNGKKANIGLIATTPTFYHQYTRMVVIVGYTPIWNGPKNICMWKKCDSYSACPCIEWLDVVKGDCPTDKCQFDLDCQGYNPASDCDGQLTGIKTYDVIEAF
jgi:hypothetical protein